MDRRNFLKTTGTVITSLAVPASAALASAPAAGASPAGRTILPLNRKWRFHPSKVAGAENLNFDDRAFTPVVLPHTNEPKAAASFYKSMPRASFCA